MYFIFQSLMVAERVAMGSMQHLLPIVLAIVFTVLFIRHAKKNLTTKQQAKALHFFALFISLSVIVYHLYRMGIGAYNFKTDLPFYLCTFMALTIPIYTYYRKYWMYEILLFWIIAGTSQAVITPDIPLGFPAFDYFRYWIAHLGLLSVIFYATFVFDLRPKLKSVFKSMVALQIYVVVMMGLNYLLGANYSYLSSKPESASVLDFFGDWPLYIIKVELLLIPYFLLIYLFFRLGERRKRTISQTTD